jgi:hypothetical protein
MACAWSCEGRHKDATMEFSFGVFVYGAVVTVGAIVVDLVLRETRRLEPPRRFSARN